MPDQPPFAASPDWNLLPRPEDDGSAAHLLGSRSPAVELPATTGGNVQIATLKRAVLFGFPKAAGPDSLPPAAGWDLIPGARGCTPQSCAYRDLNAEFHELGFQVFGISTQPLPALSELANRLHLPFPLLSDVELKLATEWKLPTLIVQGEVLLQRIALVIVDHQVCQVFFPVFPPDQNAEDVLTYLKLRTSEKM